MKSKCHYIYINLVCHYLLYVPFIILTRFWYVVKLKCVGFLSVERRICARSDDWPIKLIKIGVFIEWFRRFFVILPGFSLHLYPRLLSWNMALVDVTKSCLDSIRQVTLNSCCLWAMLFESSWLSIHLFVNILNYATVVQVDTNTNYQIYKQPELCMVTPCAY